LQLSCLEIPMKSCRESAPSAFVIAGTICRRTGLALLPIAFLAFGPIPAALAQSQAAAAAQPPAQTQAQSQTSSQSQTTAQTDSSAQPQSLADAARQAKAQQNKPKAKRVYTEDNLSTIHGTISVVGDGSSRGSTENDNSSEASNGSAPSSGNKSEEYWRSRARAIKDQIASTDQQIADVKGEIAKQGATSFDPSAGLSQGVIVIHDRNAEVKQLEDRKRDLERQLDDLGDEARKAGADSGWTR
jgi:hypothetical protein